MELADSFLIRTLFLLAPGILACRITTSLRGTATERGSEALVDSLMFAVLGYAAAALVLGRSTATTIDLFLDSESRVDWTLIGSASIASVVVATGFVAVDSHDGLHRLATWCRVTNRVSNSDVWTLFLANEVSDWHFVRDHDRGLLYYGHIHAYSDSDKRGELWLKQVRVYDETGKALLYETDDLYWAGDPESTTLETPSEREHDQAQRSAD